MKLISIINISVAAAHTTRLAHAKSSGEDTPSTTGLRGAGLRQAMKLAASDPEQGPYHYKLSDQDWGPLASGQIKIAPKDLGFNMQFAVVEFDAGGVRDLHWHRTAAEWVYVSKGSCEFTLMDDNNRYVSGVAHTGDVWYFPLGWQHSIQAIDPDDGCTTLLWFDAVDGAGSINLSDMIAAYPDDILKASLNDIPKAVTSAFPEKQNSVALGKIKYDRITPTDFPLDLWPVFPVEKGAINNSGEGGTEFAVRQEQLQAALTMSGGRIELEEGAMRELHWHTNADELHYVLSGCVRNIVHNNVDFPNTKPKEYTICAGDIGYVPKNFVHYLEAVSGPATVIATFNHPSWGTQGLSAMMSVTPVDVTASTLTTTVEVAEKYFPKESTAFLKKLPVTKTISEDPCTCENGKAKIWGPGGPHTALIPVAELFNAQVNKASDKQKTQIEICYGPESQWRSEALKCASGLMTAAEQQLAGFIRLYEDILDTSAGYGGIGTPLALHKTVLLVPSGNPKGVTSLNDILGRGDVGMVVVDGNYHDTLTSGTALWEDVIGRTGRLEDVVNLRGKVCYVASGAGDARNQLLDAENTGCDSWVYWEDWAVANPEIIEAIELPPDLQIFRDLNVIQTSNPGGSVVSDFISFAMNSKEANEAMAKAGWYKNFN